MLKCAGKICLVIILVFLSNFSAQAEKRTPYMGRIMGKRVNVRGGSGLEYEVLTQVNLGEDLEVIEEKNGWCKLKLPHGISAWLYAKLVKQGKVNRDIVNIRSGPAVHYSILTSLKRGDEVKVIEQIEDWLKIETPEDAGGWVSGQYVTYLSKVSEYQQWLQKEARGKAEFQDIENFRKEELFKSIEEVNFDLIIAEYQKFIDTYFDLPEAKKAKERILDSQAKQEVALKSKSYKQTVVRSEDSQAQQTFLGIIRKLKKVKESGATHSLKSSGFFGTVKCFLKSPAINLTLYENKKVKVYAKKVGKSKKPLVEVEKIEVQ